MSNQAAEAAKDLGNDAIKSRNFEEALKHYTEAVNLDPSNPTYLSNRATAYLGLNQAQQALQDAESIIKLNPNFGRGHQRRGQAMLALGNSVKAYESFRKAVDLEPQNAQFKAGLAQAEQAVQREAKQQGPAGMQEQMKMLEDLFKNDPFALLKVVPELNHLSKDAAFCKKLEILHANPSKVTEYLGDSQMMTFIQIAIQYQAIAKMSQEERDALMAKEAQRQAKKEKEEELERDRKRKEEKERKEAAEAKKKADELAALTPEQRQALAFKDQANALFNAKKFNEALPIYDQAIQADPTNMVFYNNKAACYWELHDYDKCITQSQEALEVGMEHRADFVHKARAYQRLGSSHMKKGDIETAIQFFKKSMVEQTDKKVLGLLRDAERQLEVKKQQAYYDPVLAEKAKEEGNDFLKKHNFPEAVKCYSEAIKRDPSNHIYYSNRSTAYSSLLAFPEALKDANKCIELKPDFVKGYARKGKAQFGMKDYKAAFESYLKGFELDNNNQEIIHGLQKTREKLDGNMDEETVMRNIERDPVVQQILRDPMIQPVLDEMKRDPRAAQKYLNDPEVGPKLEKLIEVGVIRTK